jgi:hypothetical protein
MRSARRNDDSAFAADAFGYPRLGAHHEADSARLARKPSHLIAIRLMPTPFRPSTLFFTDFGCNEIVFFSGVSLVTFFAPAKKVTRCPQDSGNFGFPKHQDQRQGTGFRLSPE